jgi:hypothetical protein
MCAEIGDLAALKGIRALNGVCLAETPTTDDHAHSRISMHGSNLAHIG